MKRKCIKTAAVLLLLSLVSSVIFLGFSDICIAGGQDVVEANTYYSELPDSTYSDHNTIDTLTFYSSDGKYAFSGEDASEDGTVTMMAGNTYNFSLDLIDFSYDELYPTGIFFYEAGQYGSLFLPLNEDGVCAYRYGIDDETRSVIFNQILSEHVDFIDVCLNESVSSDSEDGGSAPVFGLTGKVVVTYSFASSGGLCNQDELRNSYLDESILKKDDVVTYTLTIEGESNGIAAGDDLCFSENGTDYYATGISYNPNHYGSAAMTTCTMTIEENGESKTYDFVEDSDNERSTRVDIWFYVGANYTTKAMKAVSRQAVNNNTEENHTASDITSETEAVNEDSDAANRQTTHRLITALKALFVTAAAGAAALGLQGCANYVSDRLAKRTVRMREFSGSDTNGFKLSASKEYDDYINKRKAAVTMPLELTGATGPESWQYAAMSLTDGADRLFKPLVIDRNLVIAFTGKQSEPKEVAVLVAAFALRDGLLLKASTVVEFTVHSEGIEAAKNEDGNLEVVYWEEGKVPGTPVSRTLGSDEYEVFEIETGKRIRMTAKPQYLCDYPE